MNNLGSIPLGLSDHLRTLGVGIPVELIERCALLGLIGKNS